MTRIDGLLSAADMATLCGVTKREVRTFSAPALLEKPGVARIQMPREWLLAGRRRMREAAAATGSTDIYDAIAYLRERDAS